MSNQAHAVCTSAHLSCEARRAWEKVCFYEHVATPPSFVLRAVLPVPQRTTGTYQKVGDVSRCMFSDGGYVAKQMTHIVDGESIAFDVIEQSIRYSDQIVLKGGIIRIEAHADGTSSVWMLTRCDLQGFARFVPRFFIDYVVRAMHKIVIRDMQARLLHDLRRYDATSSFSTLTRTVNVCDPPPRITPRSGDTSPKSLPQAIAM
jgi:hypothetical protein